MFDVCAAGAQGDGNVGDGGAGGNAQVLFFKDMGADQALPIFVQNVGRADTVKLNAASARTGGKPEMHFGIMFERFKVAAAGDGSGNGLFV